MLACGTTATCHTSFRPTRKSSKWLNQLLIMTVRDTVQSSLAMYDLAEGLSRDMTFAKSLPKEPHRLFFKHTQEVWLLN